MQKFAYELGEKVVIECSGESGEVIGQGRYKSGDDLFLIRYKSAEGRAVEEWWAENALKTEA